MLQRVLIIIGALTLLVGVGVACTTDTGDLEERIAALEAQEAPGASADIAALQDQVQRNSMVAALNVVSAASLHAIDESAAAGELPEAGSGGVEAALIAVATTAWPDDLKEMATDLQEKLSALLEAMATDDAATIAQPAADAHEASHEFSHAASDYLGETAGLTLPTEAPEAGTPMPGG
ncbi:MAG: hypothetical protein WBD55_00080 [Dehalococcoidia bacterium]